MPCVCSIFDVVVAENWICCFTEPCLCEMGSVLYIFQQKQVLNLQSLTQRSFGAKCFKTKQIRDLQSYMDNLISQKLLWLGFWVGLDHRQVELSGWELLCICQQWLCPLWQVPVKPSRAIWGLIHHTWGLKSRAYIVILIPQSVMLGFCVCKMFGYNIQFCSIQNPHSSPEFSLI